MNTSDRVSYPVRICSPGLCSTPLVAAIAANVINLTLDVILIFGFNMVHITTLPFAALCANECSGSCLETLMHWCVQLRCQRASCLLPLDTG